MEIEEEFFRCQEDIFEKARKEKRLIFNPSINELREMLSSQALKTKYGNFVIETEPTSRAQMFTKNNIDSKFGKEELELLKKCKEILSKENLIVVDRKVGVSERVVRLIIPQKYSYIAYGLYLLQLPSKIKSAPDYYIIVFTDEFFEANKSKPLPKKDISVRIAFLENKGVKIIRNSTYFGEIKKGIFTFEDWFTKKRDGIFLHSGCREDYLQTADGSYKSSVSLVLALSGNGKTTLTSKILARKEREVSWAVQDDGGILHSNGSFEGFEGGGMYVKTEGCYPGEQAEIYYGLLKPATLLENVYVDKNKNFDFFNLTRTSNGRALIKRKDFLHTSKNIITQKVDNFFLITRHPLIPAISKLTLEQAVALMIIGMAIETSAGDPTKAGKIRYEFFYDPFVAGNRAEHANRFYEIVKKIPNLDFYLINTGGIGEGTEGIGYKDITVSHTLYILDSILRKGLITSPNNWQPSPLGFKVPSAIRNVDSIYFHPEKLFSKEKFKEEKEELFGIYRDILQKFEGLNQKIKNVF